MRHVLGRAAPVATAGDAFRTRMVLETYCTLWIKLEQNDTLWPRPRPFVLCAACECKKFG